MGKIERLALIKKIQEKRGSRVVTYFLSDRPGYQTLMGSDTPRIFYEHLANSDGEKIPKFLSSPWR